MADLLFKAIILILLSDYLFERFLDFLNEKQLNRDLPDELIGIYNAEEYKKSMDYYRTKQRFSFFTETFSLVLVLFMLFVGGFGYLDGVIREITSNEILLALLFFGIIGIVSDFLGIPFDLYAQFVIEDRYGFNKMTVKTFITDKLKSWLLISIIGGGLISLIIWIFQLTGSYFWVLALAVITLFSVFMAMFYTTLILPLFNKQTPLEPGELRDNIVAFSRKTGFKLDNIYVMDGSRRSTKGNAFFAGLGPVKRIVLYDTLINDLNIKEITAVLAHEIGHYKKHHVAKSLLISVANSAFVLFLLSMFLQSTALSSALGAAQPGFHINALAFGILYSPVSFGLGLIFNVFSRKNEYQADKFAADNYDADALIEGLKKLSVKSLSNLRPHPLYVFFNYSHPTLLQRIAALKIK
jgi:STE24 endopeptidase